MGGNGFKILEIVNRSFELKRFQVKARPISKAWQNQNTEIDVYRAIFL